MTEFIKKTKEILDQKVKNIKIPETKGVLVGRGYQAVLLDGTMGVGFAPRRPSPTCTVFKKPGSLYKTPAIELAELVISEVPIERSIGIGALNAISQCIVDSSPENYNKYINLDLEKLIPLNKNIKVGMVGQIGPFIKLLATNSAGLTIIDDNPAIQTGKQGNNIIVSRNIADIENCDVVIITGSTVIEHSLEGPLKYASNAIFRVVIGPSASWIPDAAFDLGLDAVSGMKFINPDDAFRVIMEGGGTMHFVKYAEKYTLTKEALPDNIS